MLVTINNQVEDKGIDDRLRRYGIRRASRALGVSAAYLSDCLKGEKPISEERYRGLVELLGVEGLFK